MEEEAEPGDRLMLVFAIIGVVVAEIALFKLGHYLDSAAAYGEGDAAYNGLVWMVVWGVGGGFVGAFVGALIHSLRHPQ